MVMQTMQAEVLPFLHAPWIADTFSAYEIRALQVMSRKGSLQYPHITSLLKHVMQSTNIHVHGEK